MTLVEFRWRGDLLKGGLSSVIDHLRWISALCVCAAHTRNLLFPDAKIVPNMNIFMKLFYFLTLFATEAVVVFFVVSGLLVGGKIIAGARHKDFSIEKYGIDRLTRLYIVLLPAIMLSLLLSPVSGAAGCHSSGWQIAGSSLFLQNVFIPALCNNFPLWSLSNEFFYYAIAGLIGTLIVGRYRLWAAIAVIALTSIVVFTDTSDPFRILNAAPLWCLGIVPWFLRIRISFAFFGAVLIGALLAARVNAYPSVFVENLVIAAVLVLTLCSNWNLRVPGGKWAAGFSYSLYLVHFPLAETAAHFIPMRNPYNAFSYIEYAGVLAAIVGVAWLFGRLFEAQTGSLRDAVSGWVGLRASKAALAPPR